MKPRAELKFAWALGLAALFHGVALLVLARFPVTEAHAGGLEEVQVFDAAAQVQASPVTLVNLDAVQAPRPRRVAPRATPEQVSLPEPEPEPERERRVVRPAPVPVVAPTRIARPLPSPSPLMRTRRPGPPAAGEGRSAEPAPGPVGRAGGGPIDLGPGSPGGSVGVPSGGGTSLGEVPGTGSGRGSGTGSGPGSGGGGEGTGSHGTGTTSGGGNGGKEPSPEPKFTSRLADRAEPEVAQKGRLVYPEAAAGDGVEGTCVLKVLVGENGEVLSVEVTRSAGDRRLDKAAMEYVRRWRYRPAVQDGQPRRVNTRATVQFALD